MLLLWSSEEGTERIRRTWQFTGEWQTPVKAAGHLPSSSHSVGVWSELSQLVWAGRLHEEAPVSPTLPCPLAGYRFSFFVRAQSLSWHGAQARCSDQCPVPTTYSSSPPRLLSLFSPSLSLSLSRLAWLTLEKWPSVQPQHTAPVPVRLFVVQLWGGGSPAQKTSPPPFSSDNSPFCCVARDRLVCEIGLAWCQGTVWSWLTAAF